MCGIAGFVGHRRLEDGAWRAMHAAIQPRGPDARHAVLWNADFIRTETAPAAALLHTRLSIRDLREVADQPMRNADGSVWICYNGEVYGWEKDADELRRRGYAFNTTGDTEFILHAYVEWGPDCLSRLRGMFAFAILDLRRRRLFLARDRMGIKPLVYAHHGKEFAFASTVRALLPWLPGERRHPSPAAIDAYLAHRTIPAPHTIVEGVHRLPHGHQAMLDLDNGKFEITRYWQPAADPEGALAERIAESVRLRTVSDRPVGIFLSGGIDSTVVAGALAREGFRDITAYTASFPGTDYDESAQAAEVARRLGLRHEILPIEHHVADDFDRIVADLDEPFADPSSFPLWYIARAASRHVKVVMGGDGGDELFAGYKRYARHLRSRWRRGLRLPIAPSRVDALPGRGGKWRDELAMSWPEAYSLRFSGMPPSLRRFLQPALACVPAVYWDMMPRDAGDPLTTLLDIDMHNYLPEYILRKGDLCTMAHGLELRVPLLDHRLYQRVLALPAGERFTQPAKQALAQDCKVCGDLGLLQQKKRGFNPPVALWLRRELRTRLDGLGPRLQSTTRGQLAAERVDRLVAAFLGGDEARAEQVLQLLILDVSLKQLADGPYRVH
jgi:asparagine synthase (glutamine-hydrolysing)